MTPDDFDEEKFHQETDPNHDLEITGGILRSDPRFASIFNNLGGDKKLIQDTAIGLAKMLQENGGDKDKLLESLNDTGSFEIKKLEEPKKPKFPGGGAGGFFR